jgi:hypothetical protein
MTESPKVRRALANGAPRRSGISALTPGLRVCYTTAVPPSVTEAIQWHNGEAAQVRLRFNGLTLAEKDALIAFVSRL